MIDERGFELVQREKEKALLAKTFAGECETLKETIRSFIAILLKEIRKPCLRLCKFVDVLIENFSERMK